MKNFFSNGLVQFLIFCAVFIGIGGLAMLFSWMYWPALIFYALCLLGVLFMVGVGIYNAITGK